MDPLHDKHFSLETEELIAIVDDCRLRTQDLIADLSDSQLDVPRIETVNPIRWEIGHIAFFFESFVLEKLGKSLPILPEGSALFDSFTVDHDIRWTIDLPSRDESLAYMKTVRDGVVANLESGSTHGTSDPRTTYLALLASLHEDMHGEALTYTRQTLEYPPPKLTRVDARLPELFGAGPHPGDTEIPGGTFHFGARELDPFVFDNEKWGHPVEVAPFRIARAPVTNAEYSEFVRSGGYLDPTNWNAASRRWRESCGRTLPSYWRQSGDEYQRRHFDQWIPLEPHAPVVHVTWYEAEAYARWAGRRLPTELEWEVAAAGEPDSTGRGLADSKRRYPWGDTAPGQFGTTESGSVAGSADGGANDRGSSSRANLDSGQTDCVDVAAYPAGDSAFGCRQMLGNVWEWTASAFYPFPGYLVDHPYREYSAPWFGYRKVLRGGAWATRSRLIHNGYRNFFLPDRHDIFAGFRTCAT